MGLVAEPVKLFLFCLSSVRAMVSTGALQPLLFVTFITTASTGINKVTYGLIESGPLLFYLVFYMLLYINSNLL